MVERIMVDQGVSGAGSRLEVGHVGKAHGLKGECVVRLTTNRAERLVPGSALRADGVDVVVAESRPHQDRHLVRFEGRESREAAEELRGALLTAEPMDDADTMWAHDLIGAAVFDTDGTHRGDVAAIEANPASDLLVLDTGHLVPLTFLVSFADGEIVIDPPSGLFDS